MAPSMDDKDSMDLGKSSFRSLGMMHFLTTQICKNKCLEKGDSIVKVVRLFFGRMTGRWVEEGGTHEEEAELISNVSEERSE